MKKKITPSDKVAIVCNMKEIKEAVAILYALYKDVDAKAFIRYGFNLEGREFEIIFQEVKKGVVK